MYWLREIYLFGNSYVQVGEISLFGDPYILVEGDIFIWLALGIGWGRYLYLATSRCRLGRCLYLASLQCITQ